MDAVIEPLTPAHLEACYAIARSNGARPWQEQELLQPFDAQRPGGVFCHVALDRANRRVLGWLSARPDSVAKPERDRLRINLMVDPSKQRRGIGTALLNTFEALARDAGVVALRARAIGTETVAIGFLMRNGFVEDHRMLHLRLVVPSIAPALDPDLERGLNTRGIRFTELALGEVDDALLEDLAELSAAVSESWPPYYDESNTGRTPVAFREYLVGGAGLPMCIFLAWHGQRLVGLSNVTAENAEQGELSQGITAVHPAYIRAGIGQALKIRVVRFAAKEGFREVATANRADNGPMLHINEKFGFERRSEELRFAKLLS